MLTTDDRIKILEVAINMTPRKPGVNMKDYLKGLGNTFEELEGMILESEKREVVNNNPVQQPSTAVR